MPTESDSIAWDEVAGLEPPPERAELEDLELLAEVSHPVRSRILRRLKDPRSVAQLADDLDMPVTRLYHHVNRLESLGLIRVVATRRVAAVTERRYQVTALSFAVAESILATADAGDLAIALGSLFDSAKLSLMREVELGEFSAAHRGNILSMGDIILSPARRHELIERLEGLVAEFVSDADEDDPDAARMTLFISAMQNSV